MKKVYTLKVFCWGDFNTLSFIVMQIFRVISNFWVVFAGNVRPGLVLVYGQGVSRYRILI